MEKQKSEKISVNFSKSHENHEKSLDSQNNLKNCLECSESHDSGHKLKRGDLCVTKLRKEERKKNEIEFRLQKLLDNAKLANSGNIYAIHQRNVDKTGLSVNFEALMTKQCPHGIETPNGHIIPLRFNTVVEKHRTFDDVSQKFVAFNIHEKICPLCGKTLERRIRKPKRLTRRFGMTVGDVLRDKNEREARRRF